MKRFILTFALLLILPGCAQQVGHIVNSPNNPITAERLAAAEVSWEFGQKTMNRYRNWRPCKSSETTTPTNLCRKYAIYQELRRLNAKVGEAFNVARACVRNQSTGQDCVSIIEGVVSQFVTAAVATGAKP